MSKFIPQILILALVAPVGGATAHAQSGSAVYPAAPEYRPATAIGDLPAVARTLETPRGLRIWASTPTSELGPMTAGDDGAPAMVALPDGDLLVLAARWHGARAEIWAQRRGAGGWRPARPQRLPGLSNHHPALAAGHRAVWATWLAIDERGTARVVAAEWNGRQLGAAEELPLAGTGPGLPAIALDADDNPVVVWSAFDGTDTEIWVSRRHDGGWALPQPLSNNDVPDELPDIGRGADDRLLVSWSSFSPTGYYPFATHQTGPGQFAPATQLDTRPVGMTEVLGGISETVSWTGILAEGYELRLSARGDRGWEVARDIGPLATARTRVEQRNQRVLAADGTTTYPLGTLRRRGTGSARLDLGLDNSVGSRAAATPTLTGTYRGFGDSITEGIVRYNNVPEATEGYPAPLAAMLASFLDLPTVLVTNAGVGGEITSEGLGRLSLLNATSPAFYTLIMEGVNDATHSISARTVQTNLRAMVRSSQGTGGIAIISTITPRTLGGFNGGSNPTIVLYNDLIVRMARTEGALLVDQWSAFYKRGVLYSDLVHPNPAGYEHMAAAWFRGLQPLLTALLQSEDDAAAVARRLARTAAESERRTR